MDQTKTQSALWEVYDIIRVLNLEELKEVEILINRERTDRERR